MEQRVGIIMSMTYEYTVKVYADAVKGGMRTLDSIPEPYIKDVRRLLDEENWRASKDYVRMEYK